MTEWERLWSEKARIERIVAAKLYTGMRSWPSEDAFRKDVAAALAKNLQYQIIMARLSEFSNGIRMLFDRPGPPKVTLT